MKFRVQDLFLILIPVLILSCESNAVEADSERQIIKKYTNILKENGFDTTGVRVKKNGLVVEEDIFLPFEFFKDRKKGYLVKKNGVIRKVSLGNVNRIYIKVHPNVPHAWKLAIDHAIYEWNNVNYNGLESLIYMTRNSSYEKYGNIIYVQYVPDSNNPAMAEAVPPANGKPGYGLWIYEDGNISFYKKASLMVHELGHTLGFAHSNNGERTHIRWTQKYNSANPYPSAMHSQVPHANLQNDDLKSAVYIYPKLYWKSR